MGEALYLYGFVPSATELPAEGLRGIADRAVELMDAAGFQAAVSRVPTPEYGADTVESKLDDLHWVGEQGLRHERVVAWFVDHAEILPVRLLTLYSSAGALRSEVGERAERIADQFERFHDRREWDLKVAFDRDRLTEHMGELSADVRDLDEKMRDAAPGRRYLLEKKRDDLVRNDARAAARGLAAELLDELRPLAVEVREIDAPRQAAGAELPVVLTAALLVDRGEDTEVRERVDERTEALAGRGIEVALSGPWAPYRFLGDE